MNKEAIDEMTKKFFRKIEEIKSMFVVSQAMARKSFDTTLQSMEPVEGKTDNPDPEPECKQPPAGEKKSKRIFSGKNSQKFWDAVNLSKQDILYEYGCKAQELEARLDRAEALNAELVEQIKQCK